MNKAIIFLFSLLIFATNVWAQKQSFSTVNLLNGSSIKGKVLEHFPDSIIKIQTEGENIWVFSYSEIDTVYFFSKPAPSGSSKFQFCIESGTSVVGGSEFNPAFSLFLTGTYRFYDRFRVGISTGAEYFGISLLPVAGELQVDFFKRNTTPYIYVRGGYGISLKPKEETDYYTSVYKGGYLYGCGIGIRKRFSSDFAMTFSVGYRRQNTFESRDNKYSDWWNVDYERYYQYNRASLMIGFIF
jgi:hypothetical protein